MAKKVIKKTKNSTKNLVGDLTLEIISIISITISILLILCVYTENVGILGGLIGAIFKGFLGIGAYFIPIILIFYHTYVLFNKNYKANTYNTILLILIMWTFISLIHISNKNLAPPKNCTFFEYISFYFIKGDWNNGGILGAALSGTLTGLFGLLGTYLCLYCALIVLIMLFTKKSIIQLLIDIKKKVDIDSVNIENKVVEAIIPNSALNPLEEAIYSAIKNKELILENDNQVDDKVDVLQTSEIIVDGKKVYSYQFPSIELLSKKAVKAVDKVLLEIEMKENALKLERTLKSFGVVVTILNICKGPAVTRYELQPKEGVKVSKILNLSDDIALNLAAAGLRIEAPIPGKSAIGIEIPNKDIQSVYLRDIIESNEFQKFSSKLAFGVGKDVSGKIMVADIAQMPHTLIAGATGSGKSVCINTIITSILYKANPREVKIIMIDPKVVELSVYNGIPHLLVPVVTDPKKATSALNWAVIEMMNRYKLFAEHNVRDIKGYNDKQKEFMPEMVIIIDELADLMMVSPKGVEEAICRLAQMARAAGIHLIIATQRPSVDIITGVIKANIPSRIAFEVSSGIDSRTILDMVGAEKLLGKGDMLFYPSGLPKPVRIQGAFISDKEVEQVVEFVKSTGKAEYNEDVLKKIS